MISLLIAFISSFVITKILISLKDVHITFSSDDDKSGPQKTHAGSIPRIGGFSIISSLAIAVIFHWLTTNESTNELTFLLFASLIFTIGFSEDLSKRLNVRTRLLSTFFISLVACIYLEIQITYLDIFGLNFLLSFTIISLIFTAFTISGLSNAYNIIDGFNGLASMVGIITLLGLSYVSFIVGNTQLTNLSLILASSIAGFFLWNYPRGLIFLGDGGAYLIGFGIAVISIILVTTHPEVSPWFALLINSYPVIETLFTIYRRKIHQGKSPGLADATHFHTLIYRRILNPINQRNTTSWFTRNSRTAPYLWFLNGIAVIPAIIWWNSTAILMSFMICFTLLYIYLYTSIIYFKVPRWLRKL